jgi:hypothetical protein
MLRAHPVDLARTDAERAVVPVSVGASPRLVGIEEMVGIIFILVPFGFFGANARVQNSIGDALLDRSLGDVDAPRLHVGAGRRSRGNFEDCANGVIFYRVGQEGPHGTARDDCLVDECRFIENRGNVFGCQHGRSYSRDIERLSPATAHGRRFAQTFKIPQANLAQAVKNGLIFS